MRLHIARSLALSVALAVSAHHNRADAGYTVTNLVSNVAGLAANTDPNLRNPWGVAASPTGPFWVSNQVSNNSTLYNGAGVPQPLVVAMPTANSGPTGQVFNGNTNDFILANGVKANFLFANLNGQISAWNSGTVAQTVITGTGAVYTGLAIGAVNGDNVLYAADTVGSKIDVFGSNFAKLNGTSFVNSFVDPLLPTGYKVFNVQNLNGTIYVAYHDTFGGNAASNGGVVAEFGLDGHFIKQLINSGPGGPLEDPWGMVIASANFGQFSGDLLVGNKESGAINAFDPTTGAFLGLVATVTNDPTSTNNGLWGLSFGNGGTAGSVDTLYAFAGINNERDGLMVAITSVPEPSSILMTFVGIGLATGGTLIRRSCLA